MKNHEEKPHLRLSGSGDPAREARREHAFSKRHDRTTKSLSRASLKRNTAQQPFLIGDLDAYPPPYSNDPSGPFHFRSTRGNEIEHPKTKG